MLGGACIWGKALWIFVVRRLLDGRPSDAGRCLHLGESLGCLLLLRRLLDGRPSDAGLGLRLEESGLGDLCLVFYLFWRLAGYARPSIHFELVALMDREWQSHGA